MLHTERQLVKAHVGAAVSLIDKKWLTKRARSAEFCVVGKVPARLSNARQSWRQEKVPCPNVLRGWVEKRQVPQKRGPMPKKKVGVSDREKLPASTRTIFGATNDALQSFNAPDLPLRFRSLLLPLNILFSRPVWT